MASTSSSMHTKVNMNKETMRILKRVFQKCDLERVGGPKIPLSNNMERAARYTGLHMDVLERLRTGNINIKEVKNVDRADIHNELMNFYLCEQKLPTTWELFNALHTKIPPYVDIKMLRKLLVKMGYMWKYITNYTLVVIESPKVTFERYFYLRNITQYREENKPIYFVNENILREHPKHAGGFYNLNEKVVLMSEDVFAYVTYAVSKNGVHFVSFSREFEEDSFENWATEYLSSLTTPSVIVLQNSEYNSRELAAVPDLSSLKVEMKAWLDYHSVPYGVDMSKTELFSLIENYTNVSEKLYKIDNILKLHGHVVLRLPESMKEMSPGHLVQELIKQNFSSAMNIDNWSAFLQRVMNSIPAINFQKYDEFVADEEMEMLSNDKKVDQIFDMLTEKMKSLECDALDEDSDLPTFSDSD